MTGGETGGRPVVVITEVTDLDPRAGTELLEAHGFEVVVLPGHGLRAGADAPIPARASHAVAAIVGFAPFGAPELERFPSLRLICTTSTGTDMVDEAAASARGVEVLGLGGVATEEVALHALALILGALRGVPAGQAVVAAGGWTSDLVVTPPRIGALTLGLVGFGRIARELARIGAPIFHRIVAVDPFPADPVDGVELISLEELTATADVVSLHLPSTPETSGLVSAEVLGALRPGAVLVNVSRADLVDEGALIVSLDTGRLTAYAADVLEGEPPALSHPLRDHPRAMITPHVAFLSTASQRRYELGPAERIVARLTADGRVGSAHRDGMAHLPPPT